MAINCKLLHAKTAEAQRHYYKGPQEEKYKNYWRKISRGLKE